MTPYDFVAALKNSVQHGVDYELQQLSNPILPDAPEHLARFAEFIQRLSPADKEITHDLLRFIAEGSLFRVLVCLDNMSRISDKQGEFELWHVNADGDKVRLNDADGDLLNDLFNAAP